MPDPNDELSFNLAYASTGLVKRTAGIEDDDDDWTNEDINRIIKAVMKVINKEIGVTENLTMPVTEDLQLATAYLCSAVMKGQLKSGDESTKDRQWRDHLEIGMMFLQSYLKDPAAFATKFGFMIQSAYLTRPANPEIPSHTDTGNW